MSDEIEQVAPEGEIAPVDTRAIIEAAVAKQRDVVEPVEAVEAAPEADAAEDRRAYAADALQRRWGRFAPKDGETPPVEATAELERQIR